MSFTSLYCLLVKENTKWQGVVGDRGSPNSYPAGACLVTDEIGFGFCALAPSAAEWVGQYQLPGKGPNKMTHVKA